MGLQFTLLLVKFWLIISVMTIDGSSDCTSMTCSEHLTYKPLGSPCGCVWPIQVKLRLGVAIYTLFPLVSELAQEIAASVGLDQRQVRVMGANAASQELDKSTVLVYLVPWDVRFDHATALVFYKKFWKRQIFVKASLFGPYEVVYVRYPGLPTSPPAASSSVSAIDDRPYSGSNNHGQAAKPLGVYVPKARDGFIRGMIAVILLSSFSAFVVCSSGIIWLILSKYGACVKGPEHIPLAITFSPAKPPVSSSGMTYAAFAKNFSLSDIERATNRFDDAGVIGEGGFGIVYRGILDNGVAVAVKVVKRKDQRGEQEFLAEVGMLSCLHHRNLVKMIGLCTEGNMRCLAYELVPNGSLESHLHGVDKETNSLDWGARMKIALGAARGLATELEEGNKYVSTHAMGTFGYLAPEYAMTGHLLVKSDVYSYGVVLLELLTGRKPVDLLQPPGQESLVAWARPFLTTKEGLETVIDPSIKSDISFDSISKVAAIASMCVQPEASHRPFMTEIVQALRLKCNEFDEISGRSSELVQAPESFQPSPDYDINKSNISKSASNHLSIGPVVEEPEPGSFTRHFWQRIRRLSRGSQSEHGFSVKIWPGISSMGN
ncbi:hypothetical protein V6N13_132726 [Hibiscus sabdariffa]|uniref:Protein kinase domain-containing protein n=1 Tax=Hibiscus sabdariffa TaxID=183260 RepID=A0ABR2PW99_9ROSI